MNKIFCGFSSQLLHSCVKSAQSKSQLHWLHQLLYGFWETNNAASAILFNEMHRKEQNVGLNIHFIPTIYIFFNPFTIFIHRQSPLETATIFNLSPGESYLIYVTINLDGKILPYQSLKVKTNYHCHNELFDSREVTTYYWNSSSFKRPAYLKHQT